MSSREQTRESRGRFLAMACALTATGWIFASLQGCEILVGSTVSDLPCVDGPGACPSGQACVRGTCTACSGSSCQTDASPDVSIRDGGPPSPDALGVDVRTRDRQGDDVNQQDVTDASKLLGLGATCTVSSMCASGLCGDSLLIVGLSVGTGICTQPCCTSGDCGTSAGGAVCYPSVGGNYCVGGSLLDITTLGGTPAGGECGGDGDCRSGVCDTGNSICEDTCCLNSDCATNVCQSATFEGSQNYNCGPSNSGGGQASECLMPSDCESELCVGDPAAGTEDADLLDGYCYAPCCSQADCPNKDNLGDKTSCSWADVTNPDGGSFWSRSCVDGVSPKGTVGFGGTCTGNTQCTSGLCNVGRCTIPCCGSGAGINDACGPLTCGHATFDIEGTKVDLQVCVPD